jgi:hypothetical protein
MVLTEKDFDKVNWIHLAHGRDKWWALVNMVMNAGNFWGAAEKLLLGVTYFANW